MKPKTMILMGLAITCGLGASYMTSQLLADRHPSEEQKVAVLVAKKTLSVGEPIRKPEELFERKEFTTGQEPKEALAEKDMESLKGKIMKVSLRKGDHVTANDVSGEGGLQIPEGHYAMGFPVNNVTSAFGFATLPLSRVNILLTIRRGDDKSSKAKVLLRNILVLAADVETGRDKGITAPASVVTFALKPEEALKMRLAQEMGPLTLALRKPNDKTVMDTGEVNGESITTDGKKEDEPSTASSVPELPKKFEKPAPTVLPQIAAKPSTPKAAPPVVQAQEQPKTETPETPEGPKGKLHTFTIQNNQRVERLSALIAPDGTILESSQEAGPAPPRKKNSLPQQDF